MADVLQTRLHETLRESLSGTYGVSANANYSDLPVPEYSVNISFGSDPARNDELVKSAMQQVELLKTEGPTEKQVNDAKEKQLRDYETSSKQNGYWVQQLSLRYQSGEPIDSLFSMPDLYKQVTAADVKAAAQRYLNPANHVVVTLFPEKK
jgi:zinc protease